MLNRDRIRTSHVGSLARPTELLDLMAARANARDPEGYSRALAEAVNSAVRLQADAGIDIVSDGEMSKASFVSYVNDRLGGFETRGQNELPPMWHAEIEQFPDYYKQYIDRFLSGLVLPVESLECTGPISYIGDDLLRIDVENLKAAGVDAGAAEIFLPSSSPTNIGSNSYYDTDQEFSYAVADAMRVEYQSIIGSGLLLQIDDPWLVDILSDPTGSEEDNLASAEQHVELLNHALAGLPAERIRHHTCYGLNHGPRLHDIDLLRVMKFALKVNVGGYSFEAANPRHMHEYTIWDQLDLPDDRVIFPGLVGHATNYVEHPELIAEYIARYAERVGRERVIACTDCGFSSQATYTTEVHPTVAPYKLQALTEGARLASARLW
jgi:5-methyltetrahydropteroyltriglutamate--homocysteine methyltransferase